MSASRREFLQTAALAGSAALAADLGLVGNVHAQGAAVIKVGLIGCGGRGTGAASQCLHAAPDVRLVAVGDVFEDKIRSCLQQLNGEDALRGKIDVPRDRQFAGLNAYQSVIANCDLVLLATPPGFRPLHLQTAVTARKNIFTEKPVAVDGAGIRLCLELFEQANRQHLSIVAGTQRRYQTSYIESMKKIHAGDLGTITSTRCYWNQGPLWNNRRREGWSDLTYQLRNWYYFTWLCGDHIVEQHVHNLDVVNWALGNSHPLRAVGLGGRQVRTGPEFGQIFDHFAVDYEYPNNVHCMSMCRQIAGCANNISEAVIGTRGKWDSGNHTITGERPWRFPPNSDNSPYDQEHVALIRSIRSNEPINDLKKVAESTMTAIMGRMACYTGQAVTWEQALNASTLMPQNLAWDMRLPDPPVAVPGRR